MIKIFKQIPPKCPLAENKNISFIERNYSRLAPRFSATIEDTFKFTQQILNQQNIKTKQIFTINFKLMQSQNTRIAGISYLRMVSSFS